MTRLGDIDSLIPPGTGAIADIGYDHGRLLEQLRRSRPGARLYGVERQPEAAARFRTRVEIDPEHLQLFHGDGLAPLVDADVDVDIVVFAGLGESTIVEILQRSPEFVSRTRRMIFTPEKPRAVLRPYLRSIGWSSVEERLSCERGRFYPSFAAESGRPVSDHPFWLLGPDLFEQDHPLLRPFLEHMNQALARPAAASEPDSERGFLAEYRAALARALEPPPSKA